MQLANQEAIICKSKKIKQTELGNWGYIYI